MRRPETLAEYLLIMESLRTKFARIVGYRAEDVLADQDKQLAAERLLQELADCALDIGRDLLTERGLDPGTTGRISFKQLVKAGIIGRDLAERLADHYGLRNALVHGYLAVDEEEIIAQLPTVRDLMDDYMNAVTAYLRQRRTQDAPAEVPSANTEPGPSSGEP
jgi:uncharacterized protein YutE (UPF0331/DUF86 family)